MDAMKLLSEAISSPDKFILPSGQALNYNEGDYTFFCIDDNIISHPSRKKGFLAHTGLFHYFLSVVNDSDSIRYKDTKDFFKQLEPSKPITSDTFKRFRELYNGSLSTLRRNVLAGRAWRLKEGSALAFWSSKAKTQFKVADIIDYLKLKSPVLVVFGDSNKPYVWGKEKHQDAHLKSKNYPRLTPRQLQDILLRYHTDKFSLSSMEWDVLKDVYNIAKPAIKQSSSNLSHKFLSTFGDSYHGKQFVIKPIFEKRTFIGVWNKTSGKFDLHPDTIPHAAAQKSYYPHEIRATKIGSR